MEVNTLSPFPVRQSVQPLTLTPADHRYDLGFKGKALKPISWTIAHPRRAARENGNQYVAGRGLAALRSG